MEIKGTGIGEVGATNTISKESISGEKEKVFFGVEGDTTRGVTRGRDDGEVREGLGELVV